MRKSCEEVRRLESDKLKGKIGGRGKIIGTGTGNNEGFKEKITDKKSYKILQEKTVSWTMATQ